MPDPHLRGNIVQTLRVPYALFTTTGATLATQRFGIDAIAQVLEDELVRSGFCRVEAQHTMRDGIIRFPNRYKVGYGVRLWGNTESFTIWNPRKYEGMPAADAVDVVEAVFRTCDALCDPVRSAQTLKAIDQHASAYAGLSTSSRPSLL